MKQLEVNPAMPLTKDQVKRQQTEGSLRRKFDHLITHLTPEQLTAFADRWESVESALVAIATAGTPSRVVHITRPVCENGVWHEKECE